MTEKFKIIGMRRRMVTIVLFTIHCSLFISGVVALTSCSESDDTEATEYANWKARNEAFFLTLEDSLNRGGDAWRKIKTYTKDPATAGVNTDYIYVKVLEAGDGTTSPLYSDSVRISYRGRLIPSVTYPQGYVFDQTYIGTYHIKTTGVADVQASNNVDGFSTALQYMHKGDRWLVYIPYNLGYGVTEKSGIPAYSTLIFDLVLIDYVTGSESLQPWTSRRY